MFCTNVGSHPEHTGHCVLSTSGPEKQSNTVSNSGPANQSSTTVHEEPGRQHKAFNGISCHGDREAGHSP